MGCRIGVVKCVRWIALSAVLVCGAAAAPAQERQVAVERLEGAPLWVMRGDAGTVYVLGSMHAAQRGLYPLPAAVERAFAEAEVLVVEVEVSPRAGREAAQLMAELGTLPAGRQLTRELDEPMRRLLEREADRLRVPMEVLDRLRPWAASVQLALAQVRQAGFDVELGVDRHLVQRAQRRGMPIETLETALLQMEVFRHLPAETELAMLRQTLEQAEQTAEQLRALEQAWKEADLERIEALMLAESLEAYPQLQPLYERMFDQRNEGMAKRIREYLEREQVTLVVVGVGHVVGERGVVRMLMNDG